MSLPFRSNWNLEVLVFEERGKRENRRETSRNKERTNNKLNPHMASTPGFEPGPNWWEANAPTTAQPLLPKLFREPFLSYHRREEWWEKGKRSRERPTPFISSHRFPLAAVLTIIVIVLFLENQWETLRRKDYTDLRKDYAVRNSDCRF